MKKTQLLFSVPAAMLLMVSIGCDPIKDDAVSYANTAIPAFNQFSAEVGKKMQEAQSAPDGSAYAEKTRKEILPLFKDFQEKMAAIKPATKELQQIHEDYLAALRMGAEGLRDLANAIDQQDQSLSKTAQEKIEASAKAEQKYRNDFDELAKKHGVKLQ